MIQEREGWYHYRAPGGENGPDLELRMKSFITDLRLFYPEKRILISGHGHWIIFFQRIIENLSLQETHIRMVKHTIKNASIVSYESSDNCLKPVLNGFIPWEGQV